MPLHVDRALTKMRAPARDDPIWGREL